MRTLRPPAVPPRSLRSIRCPASSLFDVRVATNSAELRSIASLRAVSFFASASCTEFAAQSHIRLRADSMWAYLEDAYAETDPEEQGRLVCFYAALHDHPNDPLAMAVRSEMDLSCTLPADNGLPPRIVLGSLDLSIGPRLGGEHLAGRMPPGATAQRGRAYISNVCVAAAARRKGIASALVAAAHGHAADLGVSHLYVHAAVDNPGATSLYGRRCGFEIEQEESAELARSLGRARRLLLRKTVLPPHSLHWQLAPGSAAAAG